MHISLALGLHCLLEATSFAIETVDEAIDSIMEGSDDEAEGAEILNGVLEEIGLEVNAKVLWAAMVRTTARKFY